MDVPSAFHRVSSRVRAVRMEGTSHWLQMDDPAAFNRLMVEFLRDTAWQEQKVQQHPGGEVAKMDRLEAHRSSFTNLVTAAVGKPHSRPTAAFAFGLTLSHGLTPTPQRIQQMKG